MMIFHLAHAREEESPRSVLIRTAYANGLGSVAAMGRAFGAKESLQPFAWQMKHSTLVSHLASHEDLNGHQFHAGFYTQLGRTSESPVEVMGLVVPSACIRTNAYSFCPECIKAGSHSSILDLRWVDSCPAHDCELESACPRCLRGIRWTLLTGVHCQCGFDLGKTPKKHLYSDSSHRLLNIFRTKDQPALERFIFALRALRSEKYPDQSRAILDHAARIAERDEAIFDELVQASTRLYPCLPMRALLAPWLISQDPWVEAQVQRLLQASTVKTDESGACTCAALELYQDEMVCTLKISPTKLRSLLTRDLIQRKKGDGVRWKYSAKKLCKLLEEPQVPAAPADSADAASLAAENSTPLTLEEAAIRLGVYPEAVRRACSLDLFQPKAIKGLQGRILLPAEAVDHFSENFVFVGQLAVDLGLPRTTLSAKLLHLNVLPISGPTVDGGLVTVYRQTDVSGEVRASLQVLTHYKSNAGRKHKSLSSFPVEETVSSANTARALGVVLHDLKHLEREGFIQRAQTAKTGRHFTADSVAEASSRLNKMVTLKVFSTRLGMTPQTFSRRYIQSEFVPHIRLGSKTLLSLDEVERIQQHRELYVTFCEADQMLVATNGHTANLVRLKRLSPLGPDEFGYVSTVRLLHRHDVDQIK